MKLFQLLSISCVLLCASLTVNAATIATFADPAPNGDFPVFTVDLVNDLVIAGWSDDKLNLDLKYSSGVYEDAYFTMTNLAYTGGLSGGTTGGGTIKFFENGTSNVVFQIDFAQANLNVYGMGGSNVFVLFADGVTFSGSLINPAYDYFDESFAFSFANQAPIEGNIQKGYTATAAFTSSADFIVPEPATLGLLLLGIGFYRRTR